MKRAALTIAAVLAAWTLTAATVRTATETFVTNRIAIALQSATDYTDSAIVFEAGAATNYTDSTASTLRDSIAGKADATNTYTKAETDAKIVELAPAPGNYAAVSNAAMAAKATLEGVFDPEQPTFVPYAVRAENADYASFASDAGRADEAQNAASLDGRDGDGIIAQLNAATKTNALQQAALAGKQDTLPFPTNEIPYAAISGTPNLATVATSGSYNDLTDKPTIPVVPTNVSAFVNDAGYLTSYTETDPVWTAEKGGYATTNALAAKADDADVVHTTGNETISGTKNFTGGIISDTDGTPIDTTGGLHIGIAGRDDRIRLWQDKTDGNLKFYRLGSWEIVTLKMVNGKTIAFAAANPTAGNLAALDADGNPVDSGKSAADFATAGALSAAAQSATNYTDSALGAALAGKQDILPYATNAIPYAAITGKPTLATVATSGSYNDLTDKPTIPSPTAPVASATLAWQSNGSAIVVSVGAAETLSSTLTGWVDGQTQTALITLAAGASVSSEVKLVGYGTWPTGGQFLASATRVGAYVYVTPIVLVN